jgi:hypothetical protein
MSEDHLIVVVSPNDWFPIVFEGETLCYARRAMLDEPIFLDLLADMARRKRGPAA